MGVRRLCKHYNRPVTQHDIEMSRLNTFVAIAVAALLTACDVKSPGYDAPRDGRIELVAGIKAMEDRTPVRASAPAQADVVTYFSPEKPLVAAVWFSTERGKYSTAPQDPVTHLPAHIVMTFKEPSKPVYACYDAANDIFLQYKSHEAHDNVYCVGMHPATGWDETSPTVTSHAINGREDLMFSKEIQGNWSNRFGKGLTFEHLLTWVTVVVVATSHDAVGQWGCITHLEIESQPTVTVDLATGSAGFTGGDIPIVVSGSEEPVPLHITSYEIASVLCSPKAVYKLTLETERFGRQSVNVRINDPDGNPINDADAARLKGKNIVITLYFGNVIIDGKCILDDWIYEEEELHVPTP